MAAKRFSPGDEVVLRSTGELVEVVAQHGANVMVRRLTGTQWTHDAADLDPYPPVCPLY